MSIRLVSGRRLVATAALLLTTLALAGVPPGAGGGYPTTYDLGTAATADDIKAVAIAIGPDGRGLPPGQGDPTTGKLVYERSCAACHGADMKGVANLPNMPSGAQLRLIGGRGTLASPNPVITVESYWPYATTLFDYVRRAMPFLTPGTLTDDEVYAVCAYILAEARIIERSTVLDRRTLPQIRMPNRDGFVPDPRPELFR